MIIVDPKPESRHRELLEAGFAAGKPRLLGKGKTALSLGLSQFQTKWLVDYCSERWQTLHSSLSAWRQKLTKYERMWEGNFSDRIEERDQEKSDNLRAIFEKNNHSLGVVKGFANFQYAQARDDIFGTKPWLGATPQGANDVELADVLTKFCQYKFDLSNLEPTLIDSIACAANLGTAFVKCRYQREVEEFETVDYVAHSIAANAPIFGIGGDYIKNVEDLPPDIDGADVEWREMLITEQVSVYNNIATMLLDYKDVAFDSTAPELTLLNTDFFHRFRMRLLDVAALYELTPEQVQDLRAAVTSDPDRFRDHRAEERMNDLTDGTMQDESNPMVTLIEGFVRCDPTNKGKPSAIHIIFSDIFKTAFRADYLPNVTPAGILPVFPVRCFKVPGRIYGKGYWEEYEDANNVIDGHYNSVTYRNRMAANPIGGFHRDAVVGELEGQDVVADMNKLYELQPEKKLEDFIEYAAIPDLNNRSIELLNQMLQMMQMTSGITSAATGELKGVPESNTATGVNAIMSRGAQLLKWPIDQMARDLVKPVEFAVHLIFANQDQDETFTWGEGKDAQLLAVKAGDVRGLRMNVALTMAQSQTQTKLQNAQVAIQIGQSYVNLPEPEKAAQRRLYLQAIRSLGFNDADRIVRDAVTDPLAVAQMLPQELQEPFIMWLQSMQGGMPQTPMQDTAAPVLEEGAQEPPSEQSDTPEQPPL